MTAYLVCIGLFLAVLGARLLLIGVFGSDLPIGDQWGAEAAETYVPYFEGHLDLGRLFAPFGEHRIPVAKLLFLLLTIANGQWDPVVQMVVGAFLASAIACALFLICVTGRRPSSVGLWCGTVALLFILPFGWENTLSGFNVTHYILILFSVVTIHLLVTCRPWSSCWVAGCVAALCALLSMASGFLAVVAVALVLVLDVARARGGWLKRLCGVRVTLAFCFLTATAGCLLGPPVNWPVDRADPLRAGSVSEVISALATNLAWPAHQLPWWCIVNWLPAALFAAVYVRGRTTGSGLERTGLCVACWVFLQAAAMALGRGAGAADPPSKYMDLLSLGLLANVICVVELTRSAIPAGFVIKRVAWVWLLVNLSGLGALAVRGVFLDMPLWRERLNAQAANISGFLAKGGELPDHGIPYQDRALLVDLLGRPEIRQILPAGVREPLRLVRRARGPGFVEGGYDRSKLPKPSRRTWGSYSAQGARTVGELEMTFEKKTRLPIVRLERAAACDERGLSMRIRGEKGKWRDPTYATPPLYFKLSPHRRGSRFGVLVSGAREEKYDVGFGMGRFGERWEKIMVKCPGPKCELRAADESETNWLGFTAPTEMGPLSYRAGWLIGHAIHILAVGVLLISAATALQVFHGVRMAGHPDA